MGNGGEGRGRGRVGKGKGRGLVPPHMTCLHDAPVNRILIEKVCAYAAILCETGISHE